MLDPFRRCHHDLCIQAIYASGAAQAHHADCGTRGAHGALWVSSSAGARGAAGASLSRKLAASERSLTVLDKHSARLTQTLSVHC